MVSHFRPLLLPARARGTHFLLPLGSVILQLGVPQATVKAGWPAAFPRLAREKGFRWAVAAVSFVARSLPEAAHCSLVVDLSGLQIRLVIADLELVAGPSSSAAAAADLVCSVLRLIL